MPPAGKGPRQQKVLAVLQKQQAPMSTREIAEAIQGEQVGYTHQNSTYHALMLLQQHQLVKSELKYRELTKPRRVSKRPERIWRVNGHD